MVRKRVWRVVMLIMLLVLGFCVPLKVQSQGIPGLSQSEVTMPRLGLPIYRPSWELGDTVDPTLSLMPACAADEGNHLVLSGRVGFLKTQDICCGGQSSGGMSSRRG